MSTRRRTYINGSGGDMSRYIFSASQPSLSARYGKTYFSIYDTKTGNGYSITKNIDADVSDGISSHASHDFNVTSYEDTLYINGFYSLAYNISSFTLSIGDNLISKYELAQTSGSTRNQKRTIIVQNGSYVGYSYFTAVDGSTGKLYSIHSSSNILYTNELDSNFNIINVASHDITGLSVGSEEFSINDGFMYFIYDNGSNIVTYKLSLDTSGAPSAVHSITKNETVSGNHSKRITC